ncbi:MAG: aminopeptidase P family N-terminal domain-containing protein, partial [Deltaproteobacteria bacterium]
MTEQGIDVLIARGSSAVRGDGAAFRFLTDFPNINIPLVLIFFREPDRAPVLFVESRFQAMRAAKYSWVEDIRLSSNFFQSLTEVLGETGFAHASLGIDGLHNFPFLWGQKLEEIFPGVKLVEFGPTLKRLRAYRTPEEIKLVKKS